MHHLFLTTILTISAAPTSNDDLDFILFMIIGIVVLVGCVVLANWFNKKANHEHKFTWTNVSECLYDGKCSCGAKTRDYLHDWVVKEQDVIDDGGWRSTHVKWKSCQRCGKTQDIE